MVGETQDVGFFLCGGGQLSVSDVTSPCGVDMCSPCNFDNPETCDDNEQSS